MHCGVGGHCGPCNASTLATRVVIRSPPPPPDITADCNVIVCITSSRYCWGESKDRRCTCLDTLAQSIENIRELSAIVPSTTKTHFRSNSRCYRCSCGDLQVFRSFGRRKVMTTAGGDWRNAQKHIDNNGITSATLYRSFCLFTYPSGSLVFLAVVL